MTRKSRWKRRGASKSSRRLTTIIVASLVVILGLIALRFGASEPALGPQDPFGKAAFAAFPEADPLRVETHFDGDLPLAATLHLPAHLIEPAIGSDPFGRLGSEFGGAERTLSGVELARRVERLAAAVLPDDVLRCHTYEVGGVSSLPEAPRRTRALHVRLNPGC